MLQSAKKHSSLIFVIIVSLAFVGFALAHETGDPIHADAHAQAEASATTSGMPVKPLDAIRARVGEVKQGAGANADLRVNAKAELQAGGTREGRASTTNIMQKARGLIRQHAGLIKERFTLALRQFDKLAGRIETRIEKMEVQGIATASVEAELDAAKAANLEAKADVQAVADFVASVDESDDRAQVRAQLQILVKEAQTSLREAHQALQKVVRSLVALARENKPAAQATTSIDIEATTNE
jgi:hypothetical protein